MTKTTLGSVLRARRLGRGHTQTQVAERLGVNQSTYARWEGDRNQPLPEHLPVLADLLDTDVEGVVGLITGEEPTVTLDAVWAELEELRNEVESLRRLVGRPSGAATTDPSPQNTQMSESTT